MAEHARITFHDGYAVRDGSTLYVEGWSPEVERLRALVQALEEECAAREEDAAELAVALDLLLDAGLDGTPVPVDRIRAGEHVLNAHDALVVRLAPNPSPDPVEGDSGTHGARSGAQGAGQ